MNFPPLDLCRLVGGLILVATARLLRCRLSWYSFRGGLARNSSVNRSSSSAPPCPPTIPRRVGFVVFEGLAALVRRGDFLSVRRSRKSRINRNFQIVTSMRPRPLENQKEESAQVYKEKSSQSNDIIHIIQQPGR